MKTLPHGFDRNRLEYWLTTHQDEVFKQNGAVHSPETRFIYRPVKGATILAVAHLDTVQSLLEKIKYSKKKRVVYATGLDDRLGAYIVSDWLAENGIKASVLLTDLEECGQSTAQHFGVADEYNWIVEFDRAGEDAVTYDLDSEEWLHALENSGFKIGCGSFSDICMLPTTKCCVNIGVGYERAHGKDSYADLSVLSRQLSRFMALYDNYKDVEFLQEHKPKQSAWDYPTWDDMHISIGADSMCDCCGVEITGSRLVDSEGYEYCNECAEAFELTRESDELLKCDSCLEAFQKDELQDFGSGLGLLCEQCINVLTELN